VCAVIRGAVAGVIALVAVPVLIAAVVAAVGTALLGGSAPGGPGGRAGAPSPAARADIPASYLRLYVAAAGTCPGLDWAVLAAVGKVETDHGRSRLPGVLTGENTAGAGGPMQFLAATFATVTAAHPPPPGGAHPPSRYNPHDAIHAAAAYLCDLGAPTDLERALYAYNHGGRDARRSERSGGYVTTVLARAATYRTAPASDAGPTAGPADADGADAPARRALAFAHHQLGLPYLWGGDGPAHGDPGFDCSGLTTAAYAAAGITLPRTAQTQYRAGPLLPPKTPLQAGDLLFFGAPTRVHHVGIATGEGTLMIHAPRRGTTIRVQDARDLPDYLAASRPG
jgi:cell wall-associated NlpC family hydrolase